MVSSPISREEYHEAVNYAESQKRVLHRKNRELYEKISDLQEDGSLPTLPEYNELRGLKDSLDASSRFLSSMVTYLALSDEDLEIIRSSDKGEEIMGLYQECTFLGRSVESADRGVLRAHIRSVEAGIED